MLDRSGPPTDKEVAAHLGVSLAELHEIVTQISFVTVAALEEVVSWGRTPESKPLLDSLADVGSSDPTLGLERSETRAMLASAINSLSEREKIVITLYYFEGMTLAQIGEVLRVPSHGCARSTPKPWGSSGAT